MYNNNPFMNMNNNPYINGGMRTPQQMQEDMNRQLQQYQSAYNQAVNSQMNMNTLNSNFYGWKYQEKDDEVETCQIPTNGTPFILINPNRRVMNIVQFQNGQRYIQTFTYQPFVNYGEPNNSSTEPISKQDSINNQVEDKNALKELVDTLNKRLDNLENKLSSKEEENPFKKVGNTNGKPITNNKNN